MKKRNFKLISPPTVVFTLLLFLVLTSCQTQRETRKPERKIIGKSGVVLVAEESLEDIIKRADAGAIGKVINISSTKLSSEGNKYFEDVLAYREVTIEVEEYLFNKTGLGKEITLIVIGGEVKLPKDQVVKKGFPENTEVIRVFEDEAKFEKGEKVLVFVGKGKLGFKKADGSETSKDRLALIGAWQGKFKINGEEAKNQLPDRNKKLTDIRALVKRIKL